MPIIIEKNQGIRLQLASAVPTPLHVSREAGGYYKVRSYHGGGEFFQPENAQVILQCLGEFLPRAVERPGSDGRMEIFYQHLVNGQDVCGRTAPLDSGVNVPKSEIARLQAAIAQLKAKENDAGTDPTKREIIRAFRLPSPEKDPELYRLHGSGASRRLLVLWGVEKEAGSSLAPQEALQRVPQAKSSIPWWYWLLLALLLLFLLGWWWSARPSAGKFGGILSDSGSSPPVPVADSPSSGRDTGVASDNSKPIGPTVGAPGNPNTEPSKSSSSSSGTASSPPGTAQAPSPASSNGTMPAATNSGSPTAASKNDPPSPSTPGDNAQAPNTLTSRRSNTLPDDPKQQSMPSDQPKTDDPKKSVPTAAEKPPAAMSPNGKDNAEAKKADPGRPGDVPPTTPSSSSASTPQSSMAPEPAKGAPQSPVPNPNQPKMPGASSAPPAAPLSAEIVNARTSAAPKDGKVEMQLSILARDADGKAITISKVAGWSVDGKAQNDDAGRPITTNGLPVNLTEGVHRVRVTGTAADGRPVSAEADVNVDIAVRQETTVRVKQVGKP